VNCDDPDGDYDISKQKLYMCFDATKGYSTLDLVSKESWSAWKHAHEKNFDLEFDGEFGTYDGKGFTLDIFPDAVTEA
jgi:hypothetical protein